MEDNGGECGRYKRCREACLISDRYEEACRIAIERHLDPRLSVELDDVMRRHATVRSISDQTRRQYRTRFNKLVYIHLSGNGTLLEQVDEVCQAFIERKPNYRLCSDALRNRLVEACEQGGGGCDNKAELIQIWRFYCKIWGLDCGEHRLTVPRVVTLPGDARRKFRRADRKQIELKAVILDLLNRSRPFVAEADPKIPQNRQIARGLLILLLTLSTSLRLREAQQLKLEHVLDLKNKDVVRVDGIKLKKQPHRTVYLRKIPGREGVIDLAVELYTKMPDVLRVSPNSSTMYKSIDDFRKFVGLPMVTTTMLRHLNADTMARCKMSKAEISLYMNHQSRDAVNSYLNTYHPEDSLPLAI
ncbi:CUN018 putative vlf-1 very late expression factor 1, similar to AcMNPV ORF77 [Culex nigripalpus nucleopolyhedrovirus]|uniref:CUN018 putative vlf-1 very late expression factor 1, similar to AcMNPV ORF77 n=1 Tax=Culex nigripalpus nucleopolyhedrovirus (isolate Florida/1997) TaxID=645993 RepID=Q919Q1_NPVCO|nr:CUN018 putative vlf-1 very late expression factor 1, similar to AcMNPV ORF77 [Culex nigripalpus nucleopolyhedrovirus]AAK94096.1 CUN018 putative vlf-1 very late expression factor 1, similar to AcMNPV ORF77 [Culex nigripalpus nucleopolyhedrovirus]